jgi:hypothetical protein
MVVYCAGFPAIYGRQPLYFRDPTFAARAAVPPLKHSDSLQAIPLRKASFLEKSRTRINIIPRKKRTIFSDYLILSGHMIADTREES